MKLSTSLKSWRSDRPDEYTMNNFIVEAEKLEAERDALAAQVEALRDEIQTPYVCRFSREEKLSAILAATPQQNLAERDAQKGRDGFIAGVEARRIALLNDEQVAIKANQYADSIRQEKK